MIDNLMNSMYSTMTPKGDNEINRAKVEKKSKKKSKKQKEKKITPVITKDAETGRLLGWMGLN